MRVQLHQVVPWGRSFEEYLRMFDLDHTWSNASVLGCGDGPASFNAEATRSGWNVTSIDPIYQFPSEAIRTRVHAVKADILAQTLANEHWFKWDYFKDIHSLEHARLQSMELFLGDFEKGRNEKRYLHESLPKTSFHPHSFDLALVSHVLFLYSELMDFEFHLQSVLELLRISREVRIFPLLDLSSKPSKHLNHLIKALAPSVEIQIKVVNYEFQIGGNEMLVLRQTE